MTSRPGPVGRATPMGHRNGMASTGRMGRWQEFLFLLAVLLACGLALSKNHPDPDLWGHVQYGRDMLAGGLPRTTTYSYTTQDYPWINHEILSELLLAKGFDCLGPAGMLGLKCLLGVALIGTIVIRGARRGISLTAIGLVALLVATNVMYFSMLRPQLLSFFFYTVLLLLLDHGFRDWQALMRRKGAGEEPAAREALAATMSRLCWLWCIPPLMALWANSHGGFVAGMGLLAVYLGVRVVEACRALGRRALPLAGHCAAVVLASGLATLLNPYGAGLHAWLYDSLSQPRPEIIEWRPPELLSPAWIPWWLLVAVSVACLVRGGGRIGGAEVAVLLLLLWQSVDHRRHIPFFAIAFGMWLPVYVDELVGLLAASARPAAEASRRSSRWLLAALACVSLAIVPQLYGQLRVIPVMRGMYPVAAFQYMADQRLRGKLVVRFMWAQYALAAFGSPTGDPDSIQVAFDGRFDTCYPRDIIDSYFDFALGRHPKEPRYRSRRSPPLDPSRLLELGQPDLALLGREQPHPVRLLSGRPHEWVLLYQDQVAQLWGRRSKYGDPASPDYLPPHRRRVGNEEQKGYVPWPAFPVRHPQPSPR